VTSLPQNLISSSLSPTAQKLHNTVTFPQTVWYIITDSRMHSLSQSQHENGMPLAVIRRPRYTYKNYKRD